MTKTLILTLALSLVLVAPSAAQSTGPELLVSPHDHTRNPSWAQLVVRGTFIRAVQSRTTAHGIGIGPVGDTAWFESYFEVRLTEHENPQLQKLVRINFQNRGRITENGELLLRNGSGAFVWLRPGDRVHVVAGLGGLRSGYEGAETRLHLVSAHVIN